MLLRESTIQTIGCVGYFDFDRWMLFILAGILLRQREVLQLLAEGRSMKEVGGLLNVSIRTVAFHKYRIMEQHGLRTNSDLLRFAMKQHVVSAELRT
jgi:DNA-binding CsgD family transcriptional regulator